MSCDLVWTNERPRMIVRRLAGVSCKVFRPKLVVSFCCFISFNIQDPTRRYAAYVISLRQFEEYGGSHDIKYNQHLLLYSMN